MVGYFSSYYGIKLQKYGMKRAQKSKRYDVIPGYETLTTLLSLLNRCLFGDPYNLPCAINPRDLQEVAIVTG